QLLTEWSIKDALRVLDEIDSRVSVIETIRRLADDSSTDELRTLHPLILRSRWLFGPEFESQEYCSNATLQTLARELFNSPGAQVINERNRPDIIVLPEQDDVPDYRDRVFRSGRPNADAIAERVADRTQEGWF